MALYRRNLVWWMRFHYQGRQIRRSTETTDKKLAERIYGKVLGLIAEGKWFDRPPGHDKRVADMLDRYLTEHSAPNKAATTYRRDQSLGAHLRQAFGTVLVQELRPAQIAAYRRAGVRQVQPPRPSMTSWGCSGMPISLPCSNGNG